MKDAPKIKLNGTWLYIMTEEEYNELAESIHKLKSHYLNQIAEQSHARAEQSKESLKNVGKLASHILKERHPDLDTTELDKAIEKV